MDEYVGRRISEIIANLNIKKVEFASRLNIHQSYVTKLESGRSIPSDRLIEDICQKFSINEEWLRYGSGDMYIFEEDEDAALIADLLIDPDDTINSLIISILKTYKSLDSNEKTVMKNIIKKTVDNMKKSEG